MATLSRFEDLKIWQESRLLNNCLFDLLLVQDDRKYGFLINHIFKTSGSIMDNIAEGFEREGNKEFIQFLSIAKGSAGELRSQIYRAMDLKLILEKDFDQLQSQLLSISSQISLFINYLKKSEFKGNKFKEPSLEYGDSTDLESFINPISD
jgi:four helix bundle protein